MKYRSESREDYDDGLDYEDPEFPDEFPDEYLDEPKSRREKCSCSPQRGWDFGENFGWHCRSCFKARPETASPASLTAHTPPTGDSDNDLHQPSLVTVPPLRRAHRC